MKCPKCEFDNPEGMSFCGRCGTKLEARHHVPASLLDDPTEAHPVPNPERKYVTALFSDLTGYTTIAEKLDPEQVKEITGRIYAGIKQIVTRYDGFIERVMGDGILAFFGVPRTHEDDPVRAIYAAKEIHDLVLSLSPQYQPKLGMPLSMHSGINTGLVVTADVDRERGTHGIAGDAVNVASRLSGLASSGEIMVGHDTYTRAAGIFDFEDLGLTKVKGKVDPVHIFKVSGVKSGCEAIRMDRQVSSEMVGRKKEMDKLELQIMKVINGEGSVVNVIGEAGIGKSRLIAELKKSHAMKGVTLLEGRASSIGKNLSFHPIIDLFKSWAGIVETDSESAAFDKLQKAIGKVYPEETQEILPFVATLMGMRLTGKSAERVKGIEGEALEKLIFKNVRELVIKGAEMRPTVVVIEDLHWADTSSIELLEGLFRSAEKHRLVFINVFRPGYFDGDKSARIGKELPVPYVEIQIPPLDMSDSEILISNILKIKGFPHPVEKQIVERASGNPFFIEEVLRSLIDEGVIIKRSGGFEATDKIEKAVIPPTINDVLMARIDRLEERTRELLKVAAVIGRSFFDRIIKDVAASIEDIDQKLEYLKDVQLIRDRMRMQELEYLFKHALAQEAAYESTLIQQRKSLHLKIAQSIEKVFQEKLHEFYGILAYHYSKGDNLEKAEAYMLKAGEEALRTSASREALHYYQEGLRLYLERFDSTADPEKIAAFEKNISIALYNKAQWADAVAYLEKVLKRYYAPLPKTNLIGTLRMLYDILVVLRTLYWPSHKAKLVSSDRENEIFELAYKAVVAIIFVDQLRQFFIGMSALRRTTKYEIAKIPYGPESWAGGSALFSMSSISFALADRFLEFSRNARTSEHAYSEIQYACFTAINQHCKGAWKEIEKIDADLIDTGLRYGDLFHTSTYMTFIGLVKSEQGEFHQLRDLIERMFQIGTEFDYELATEQAVILKTDSLIKTRFLLEAIAASNEGISLSSRNTNLIELNFLGLKGEALLLNGDTEESKETLTRARNIIEKQKFVTSSYASSYLVSHFLYDLHQLQHKIHSLTPSNDSNFRRSARRSGKAALKNARKYAPYRTKTFRLMGLYYWLIGRQRKALKWWDRTIKEGEQLGARFDLSQAYFEIGKRILEPGSKYNNLNGIDANGYLEKAETLFREMGLERDLDELKRLRMEM